MTYFPDGAPYAYSGQPDPILVCAGWLDPEHAFRKAVAPDGLANRLAWRCVHQSDRPYRGIHICELCPEDTADYVSILNAGKKHLLGYAEITIATEERSYAAPNLILHYVVAHHYLPPDDFVEALMLADPAEALTDWSLFVGPYWDE